MATGSGSLAMSHPVVLPVHRHFSSSTLSTMPVRVLPMMPSQLRVEELGNSTVSSMYTRRLWLPMVLLVFTADSSPLLSVSSFTVVFSEYLRNVTWCHLLNVLFFSFGVYDSLKPVVLTGPLEGSFLASFGLGWGVTIGAGLASYPLDTIRRRMMMTSGGGVHYKSMFDAGSQVKVFCRISSTNIHRIIRLLPKRVPSPCSRVLVPTFCVVLQGLVYSHSMTSSRKLCSARSTLVVSVSLSLVAWIVVQPVKGSG